MKLQNNFLLSIILSLLLVISCKKEEQPANSDLDILRHSNNKKSVKLDSAQAIQAITKQKVQELLDLSTLYASGNKDTEIDSIIYSQMQSYFLKQDSNNVKKLLQELDSFKVKTAKINNIEITKEVIKKDTLDFANYSVAYFDKNKKKVGVFDKRTQYILKKSPVKFVKEFKFYFVDFDVPPSKDSTSVGNTK